MTFKSDFSTKLSTKGPVTIPDPKRRTFFLDKSLTLIFLNYIIKSINDVDKEKKKKKKKKK